MASRVCLLMFALWAHLVAPAFAAEKGRPNMSVDPSRLPRLGVDQERRGKRVFTMVRIAVPTIPGFQCDVWCYEDAFGQGQGQVQPDGSLVLKHTRTGHDGDIDATTRFVPCADGVDFIVNVKGQSPRDVCSVRSVNACWQLRRAKGFQRQGDFVHSFVNQCFVYTVRGFTFMRDTIRFPDTRRPATDPHNTPPWVQVYLPIWRRHGGQPKAFWGNSTHRPVYPIIGEVSRDGKWLAALAWPHCGSMCQGWHDCLHNAPHLLQGYDKATNQTTYRGKFYFMANDPKELLQRYRRDLAAPQQTLAVSARDGRLVVTSPDLPGHAIELDLAVVRAGSASATEARLWQRQWWGAWTKSTQSPNTRTHGWAWPRATQVDLYLSTHCDGAAPGPVSGTATMELDGWVATASPADGLWAAQSADGKWSAAFAWARAQTTQTKEGIAAHTAAFAPAPAGETRTLRGRLYVQRANPGQIAKLHRSDAMEWGRALPFRLPIPQAP